MMQRILLFMLWLFVWCLLSWPPAPKQIVIGAFVSLFVTFMTVDTFRSLKSGKSGYTVKKTGLFGIIKKILWFAWYFIVFLWECLKANIDVAWRVIHPALPIRPATLKIKTELKSDIGLTFLANSVTLTPGTTTVDIDKENSYIYVHILSLKPGHPIADMRLGTVTKFERILRRIFE